jgi:ribosomal protection tetracycline resistance protein
MRTLNLGILAHVDAGKTTLTERLLYAAGVIDELGSVRAGTTHTDLLALERQRGITIKTAVASFVVDGVTVNLVDTPGHPDFIAEVERVLDVLDGAILVVSAVEGVQAQTRVLMRTLRRLGVPALIFVNKIDRGGARPEDVIEDLRATALPVIPMGSVRGAGTAGASFEAFSRGGPGFRSALANALAEYDDEVLAAILAATSPPGAWLEERLRSRTAGVEAHPLFLGSALTGAGVDELADGATRLLPPASGDPSGALSALVFKIERGSRGDKIAFARIFSGTLAVRDKVRIGSSENKVTTIRVFAQGDLSERSSVGAGEIAKLWGLRDARIGDEIGVPRRSGMHRFPSPTLETVVLPRRPSERGALHTALTQLAEQDPLIDLRQDDLRHELVVSLYGEVQKEVIQATLALEYGLEAEFRETTVICVERLVGVGTAVEEIGDGNPFLATVGLRVEPGPIGSGLAFRTDVLPKTVPLYVFGSAEAFATAVEQAVRDTLREGLFGWQVVDCIVTLTRSGYSSPGTGLRDFRYLTPLVLMRALAEAETVVCEPVHRFRLEVPTGALGAVAQALARLGLPVRSMATNGGMSELEGDVAAANLNDLHRLVPGLTGGLGVLESVLDHHRPVRGDPPRRPRTDRDPLNRGEYLRQVLPRF